MTVFSTTGLPGKLLSHNKLGEHDPKSANYASGIFALNRIPPVPFRISRVPLAFQFSSSVARVSDHVQEVMEYYSFRCSICCKLCDKAC